MADVMITDGMKQQVITRLATINSATSILSLINGRPAKVTVEEVLALAARIESWAWRDLLGERPAAQTQETLAPQAEPTKPTSLVQPTMAKLEPAASNGDHERIKMLGITQPEQCPPPENLDTSDGRWKLTHCLGS